MWSTSAAGLPLRVALTSVARVRCTVLLVQAEGFDLVTVPIPTPGPGQVLLKVLAASLCGTDLKVCKWCVRHATTPATLGLLV